MSRLPKTAFNLHGGCFCSAIRYTVSVPELSERPEIPYPQTEDDIVPRNEVNSRLPQIDLDYCNSCHRVQGSLFQTWLILPQKWVQFSLQPKASGSTTRYGPDTRSVLVGDPKTVEDTFVTKFSSSEGVNRIFCSRCGTHLTFHYERLGGMAEEAAKAGRKWDPHMDLTLGSLDKESVELEGLRPTERAHVVDAVPWVKKWLEAGIETLSQ